MMVIELCHVLCAYSALRICKCTPHPLHMTLLYTQIWVFLYHILTPFLHLSPHTVLNLSPTSSSNIPSMFVLNNVCCYIWPVGIYAWCSVHWCIKRFTQHLTNFTYLLLLTILHDQWPFATCRSNLQTAEESRSGMSVSSGFVRFEG